MSNERTIFTTVSHVLALALGASSLIACAPTTHAVAPSELGVPRSAHEMEAVLDQPGPVDVTTVVGADWAVPRSGLINLDSPRAKEAGLKDGPESIVVALHAIRHPTEGLYIVDTGVERALRDDPSRAALHGLVAWYLDVDKMKVQTDTAAFIASRGEPLRGVFLTHMHGDHVSGMRDVPNDAIVYAGPGEAEESHVENVLVRPIVNAALEGKGPVREWRFAADPDGVFAGVIDVFRDGSVWAIRVPGHTAGSTAYVARTPKGPVLFTGDVCHTTWGWDHGVEPGSYTADHAQNLESLEKLRALAARHPSMDVRLGHQLRTSVTAAATRPTGG